MVAHNDLAPGRYPDLTAPTPPGAEPEYEPEYEPQAEPQPQASTQDGERHYRTGALDPRWVLLAGVWYMPAAIVGFGLHYYFSHVACQLGMLNALCNLDIMAAPGQVALMLLGFAVTLFIAASYGRGHEETFLSSRAAPPRRIYASPFTRLMCDLAEYQRARPLAWTISGLVAAGLALELLRGQLDSVTLTLGAIALAVALRCATFQASRPRLLAQAAGAVPADGSEQTAYERSFGTEATFWAAARDTPPLSWIAGWRRQAQP